MKVVPISPDSLRVGRSLPFSVRDHAGVVLLVRGATIDSHSQLEHLRARPVYVAANESEVLQRAYSVELDQMVRQDMALGRIADATPNYGALAATVAARAATAQRPLDWPDLQMRLRLLLVEPRGDDWIARLRQVRDDIHAQVERHPDRALVRLMHDASADFWDYSANHSLLVSVLAALAAPQMPGWNPPWWDALTLAALTMNLAITVLQDELARQPGAPTPAQRHALKVHAERGVELLQEVGVTDLAWLSAVRHHHNAPPGPAASLPPGAMLARLIRRADRYAARFSPRKSRPASSATAAAQAAFFDEGGHPDEAGQALVKALGLYPPGAWVRLRCGEIALVLRRAPTVKAPVVASVVGRTGMPLAVPTLRNTRLAAFEVVATVAPSQVRVRPNWAVLEKMI